MQLARGDQGMTARRHLEKYQVGDDGVCVMCSRYDSQTTPGKVQGGR